MRAVLRIIDAATLVMSWVAAIAVIVMMVQVTADVVMKNLFNAPVPATLTLVSNYYMPLITFLPLAFVERIDKHVSVEVLTAAFPGGVQKHLYGWIFLVCMIVTGFIAYAVWDEALSKYAAGTFEIERGQKIITWPVRFSAPLGYGFLSLLFALKFIAYLFGANAQDGGQRLRAFSEEIGEAQ
ncbi:TRAP transporter small permease [Maritimibacter sp. DP1N21-5]|uniref:TRAP transporter small permease n=1 Tax=Maritimibacter sp. DP1N21-5 TaxID=2836867 RepID=UPI001C4592F2|nr:TRAP transporter small permease subunit [Maritimibacter sp. DP1N21-5]MBV7407434.1 TRAP transporter small permease [Maritimibacter sp. DP1N21-5]